MPATPREPGAPARHRACQGYQWGRPPAPLLAALEEPASPDTRDARFDVILLADVVFNHNQHEQLLSTCDACLCSGGAGEVG